MDKRHRILLVKWLITVGVGVAISLVPPPEPITRESWTLFAIFIATIVGSVLQPLPGAAVVLIGVVATVIFGALDAKSALKGYADPVIWLVLSAFFLSCAMIKTGLGHRIALHFIRAMGRKTLGLGYALVSTDFVLASMVPSNAARNGGVLMPITLSICDQYGSRPDDGTENRLGAFLINLLYQCDVIICATFITGQASNIIIAKLAKEAAGIELTYLGWFAAAIVPAVISLAIVPHLIFRIFPPEIKETPAAAEMAAEGLRKAGRISRAELLVVAVLAAVVFFWITKDSLHAVDTAIVALCGIAVLLAAGVVSWRDLIEDHAAWSVFIWYGGLVNMATILGETGITKLFADRMAGYTSGMMWAAALTILLLVYFYSHYFFASITGHVLAMFVPFVAVTVATGTPAGLSVLLLAYFSNLNAGITHYGTTPGPIYFGTGMVKQRTWWTIGLVVSFVNIAVWTTAGLIWWKALGWW